MRPEEVFAERLRAARQAAGLSQYALGVLAGIDEGTAKVRINQYENRKHIPSLSIMERLADALDKPAAWFVCAPDELGILETLHSLNATVRAQAVRDGIKRKNNRSPVIYRDSSGRVATGRP